MTRLKQAHKRRLFFDNPCSGITEVGYRKLGVRQATWKYATCKHVQGAKKQPGSPVPSPTYLSMDTVMAELTKLSLQLQPLPELFKDIHCIKSDMAALSTSTQELISRIDRLEKRIDNIESIVSFINRYLKEDFVAAGKALKTLTTSDIGIPGNTRIFINDHLTVENKQLLSKTKLLAKEKNYRFVWVRHSKLFVRKNETSPVLSIKAEKDLTEVK
ncbi:uncharacterized protein LOC120635578 [Pararge aegeria]|uniref:uncharacterized protein LOC120635578 n=1 Tax=Pararge aegeria TaxID=116150 RepID=UPI0019D1B01A|nr:uncharacterized protein LOC120635578 [Pararge aegeria]